MSDADLALVGLVAFLALAIPMTVAYVLLERLRRLTHRFIESLRADD